MKGGALPAPKNARHDARIAWAWSERDEHQALCFVLVGAVVLGLVLRALPPSVDVMHRATHGLGFMAPSCGLTRAGLALVRGDLPTAWRFNPAVFLVAPLAVGLMLRLGAGAASGRWLTIELTVSPAWKVAAAVGVVALWWNQQAHFDLLAAP